MCRYNLFYSSSSGHKRERHGRQCLKNKYEYQYLEVRILRVPFLFCLILLSNADSVFNCSCTTCVHSCVFRLILSHYLRITRKGNTHANARALAHTHIRTIKLGQMCTTLCPIGITLSRLAGRATMHRPTFKFALANQRPLVYLSKTYILYLAAKLRRACTPRQSSFGPPQTLSPWA